MTYYPDHAECDYFSPTCASQLRAVGWLSRDQPFATGPTDRCVYDRLVAWSRDPWQPMLFAGPHACDLCQFDRPTGSRNLFVPDRVFAWVCPELIVHYINAHLYRPPEEFCRAVLAGPEMRSMDYLRAIRECATALDRLGQMVPSPNAFRSAE